MHGLAGQADDLDKLVDVISIEWAGSESLIYTQSDTQGRPCKVHAHGLVVDSLSSGLTFSIPCATGNAAHVGKAPAA